MLYADKKLIHLKWLIPFLALLWCFQFSFLAQSSPTNAVQQYCQNKHSTTLNKIEGCLNKEKEKINKIMKNAIKCSKNLISKYDIKESGQESVEASSEDEDDEDEPRRNSNLAVSELKNRCEQEKQSAEECCNNPNSCNGFALDLAQYVAPLTPALLGAYKSYKISDDASKGNLTHQEATNKLCNAQNTVQLSMFGTSLMSQLTPIMQKTCGQQIKKCRQKCNSFIDEFKEDFTKCYSRLLPQKDISAMIKFAKDCFEFENLNHETIEFENEVFKKEDRENKCDFSTSANEGFIPKSSPFDNSEKYQNTALAKLLYTAKAYQQTTKNQVNLLSDKSNEKEIIDCGKQPNRVLTSSNRPGSPVPPPAIQICQQAIDHAVNNTSPPPMPGPNAGNNPGNIGQVGGLAGDTRGSQLSSLNVPSGEECQYGVVDSATLENCPIDDGGLEEDFDVNKRPGLAKNLPGFKNGGGSGGSSGSGGGGGGSIGGGGGLAGDSSYPGGYGRGSSYAGDMSVGAGFPSGYESSSYGGDGGSNSFPNRKVAENSNDMDSDGMEFPENEENPNEEKSIFQIASERIQNFCDDYSCNQ